MTLEPIRRSVVARCDPAEAFRVFTEEMESWWPVATHSRASSEQDDPAKVVRIEFQGRAGGRVLEHQAGGEVLSWAEVLTWEPPRRFVLAWKPHARPQPPTEVEVTFTPHDDGTLVELEHRGWERLTEDVVEELHGSYAGGWIETLDSFAAAANA